MCGTCRRYGQTVPYAVDGFCFHFGLLLAPIDKFEFNRDYFLDFLADFCKDRFCKVGVETARRFVAFAESHGRVQGESDDDFAFVFDIVKFCIVRFARGFGVDKVERCAVDAVIFGDCFVVGVFKFNKNLIDKVGERVVFAVGRFSESDAVVFLFKFHVGDRQIFRHCGVAV